MFQEKTIYMRGRWLYWGGLIFERGKEEVLALFNETKKRRCSMALHYH